jgi:sulfatase modifying factor 1
VAVTPPDFARIPAGEFLMGAADGDEDERPVHRVFVSEFLLGRFPVTNDEYARFVRETGYPAPSIRDLPVIAQGERDPVFRELAGPYLWQGAAPPAGRGNHPIVLIRWEDAVAYCDWLSDRVGQRLRLPTEAEWEKAARGGVEGARYPWGDEIDRSRANYLADGRPKRDSGTRPTGTFQPNGFGLYDVVGNVWEWVEDWYAADYYGLGEPRDPRGPRSGSMRIVRGGSWVTDDPRMLRSAYRHQVPPDTYAYSIGFRVACTP